MARTLTEPGESARFPRPWTLVCGLFAAFSLGLFVYFGLHYADETQRELRLLPDLRYDNRVDFGYFYAGAYMTYHGQAADLYPHKGEWTYYPDDLIFFEPHSEAELARLLARGNYYNPPGLALLEAPLVSLGFKHAFWLFSLLAIGALAGFLTLAWRAGAGIPELPMLGLGVLAFSPVHEALIMGHLTLFFVFVLAAGFLLLRSERRVLAGLTLSLLALKPQWAILPGLFLLVRGEWRALATMATTAAAIFFLPFVYTGFDSFKNYYEFLRWSATIDLKDAPHMFSWNGFLSKWDGSEIQNGQLIYFADAPSKTLVYGLIALTAVPLLVVWRSKDYLLGVAATLLAMLLISTHSVWYDWAILSVSALFLVLRSRDASRSYRVEMWVVLLALFMATAQSISEVLEPDRHAIDWHRAAFFTATPVAFAVLVWMASVPLRERGVGFVWRSSAKARLGEEAALAMHR
jgi:hypothetical protein